MGVPVAALQQLGDLAEGVVAAQPDDEPDRLPVPPGRGPPRGLEDGDQLLAVQHRIGVEHPRAPPRGDVGMDRHGGIGGLAAACCLLLARALVGLLDHILTLPAE